MAWINGKPSSSQYPIYDNIGQNGAPWTAINKSNEQ